MGHRPVTGSGIILERQPRAVVRKAIEPAVLHRLADLSLDQRLAHALARWLGWIGSLRISLIRHGPSLAQDRDRQADATAR